MYVCGYERSVGRFGSEIHVSAPSSRSSSSKIGNGEEESGGGDLKQLIPIGRWWEGSLLALAQNGPTCC